jgi:RimJ/RimL family protein N-acetyltransferase
VRHDLRRDGVAFRLRPVRREDAAFIVDLRNDPALGRFLHKGAATVDGQERWLAAYFDRPGDYYFVVERIADAAPEGLVGIYDHAADTAQAEWGRWILRRDSAAAVECAMLVYECAFEAIGLARVYCRTLAENRKVVSFHDSCGLARSPQEVSLEVDGVPRAAVEHRLAREGYPDVVARLRRLAERQATRHRAAQERG